MSDLIQFSPEEEAIRITSFFKAVFQEQKIYKAVIGVSGGIDSGTSFCLLAMAVPNENIYVLHLPYFETSDQDVDDILKTVGFPSSQYSSISIKKMTDNLIEELHIPDGDIVRRGNIMARSRMIMLYDFAKENNALVVGTENRSEYFLGYFTRFGDEASDIEPLQHLYKTQVYEIAKHIGVPSSVINKKPSANLWESQTDEGEFGFLYAEADPVLYRYFDKKETLEEIEKTHPNARKIIDFANKNAYKHHVPYHL